jgi:hypothetical protein
MEHMWCVLIDNIKTCLWKSRKSAKILTQDSQPQRRLYFRELSNQTQEWKQL